MKGGHMSSIKLIINLIDNINKILGFLVSFLFIPLTCFSLFEVLMRYIFNKPTIWAWDLNMQIFAALVMLGGGYTLYQSGHVAVDVLVINMSPRRKAILDLCTAPLFFLAMSLLIWYGWEVGWKSFLRGETLSTIWGPPLWTIKMLVPVGAFFVLIQGISKFLKDLLFLTSPQNDSIKE